MERTKPINQKQKHKKVTAPVNIHYRAGLSSARPTATSERKVQTSNVSRLKGKAYVSYRKENPKVLNLSQRRNTKDRRGHTGGRERERGGRRGGGGWEHCGGETHGGGAYEGREPIQ